MKEKERSERGEGGEERKGGRERGWRVGRREEREGEKANRREEGQGREERRTGKKEKELWSAHAHTHSNIV